MISSISSQSEYSAGEVQAAIDEAMKDEATSRKDRTSQLKGVRDKLTQQINQQIQLIQAQMDELRKGGLASKILGALTQIAPLFKILVPAVGELITQALTRAIEMVKTLLPYDQNAQLLQKQLESAQAQSQVTTIALESQTEQSQMAVESSKSVRHYLERAEQNLADSRAQIRV